MKIILPNDNEIDVDNSSSYLQVLEEHAPKKVKDALAIKINDKIFDLSAKVQSEGKISIVNFKSEEGKLMFWHSSAHALAQALKRIHPTIKFDDGPALLTGPGHFFYDVYLEEKIHEDDFEKIENEIHKVVSENHGLTKRVLSKEEALQKFESEDEIFKVDIIKKLPDDTEISLYKQGEFEDMCRGPHVATTGILGHFKIMSVAGAYWKGDVTNPMLQRIYAVSFPTEKELKSYLNKIEEAKKRDHRKIGKELELFSFQDEGPGFPFYHEKGTLLFNTLSNYIQKECKLRGYKEIKTPTILSEDLWIQSGHYENFKENMYFTDIEDKGYAIKPMNCPGANLIYKSTMRSYRDLPLKFSELGHVHRHELSGVLHGLFRVRAFTQDDAHIYCEVNDLQIEIEKTIQFIIEVYNKFGFNKVGIFVATRPEKSLGSDKIWQEATSSLIDSLNNLKLDFKIKEGEGAFYGPKIEFNIEDCLERNWQCGTIQVDFSMPERFELEYVGVDGEKHRPVMVHRAILGSLERFIGILIEHYAGKLPLWLSPVQIRIINVSAAQLDYAKSVEAEFIAKGFRVDNDYREETIGYKIRVWNQQKINYIIIIGQQEVDDKTVSVRARSDKKTESLSLDSLISRLIKE